MMSITATQCKLNMMLHTFTPQNTIYTHVNTQFYVLFSPTVTHSHLLLPTHSYMHTHTHRLSHMWSHFCTADSLVLEIPMHLSTVHCHFYPLLCTLMCIRRHTHTPLLYLQTHTQRNMVQHLKLCISHHTYIETHKHDHTNTHQDMQMYYPTYAHSCSYIHSLSQDHRVTFLKAVALKVSLILTQLII